MSTYTEVMRNVIGPSEMVRFRNTNAAKGVFRVSLNGTITLKMNEADGDIELLGVIAGADEDTIQES